MNQCQTGLTCSISCIKKHCPDIDVGGHSIITFSQITKIWTPLPLVRTCPILVTPTPSCERSKIYITLPLPTPAPPHSNTTLPTNS